MVWTSLHYHPSETSSFLSHQKLEAADLKRGHSSSKFGPWLQRHEAYTLNRSERKRFYRNPYTVNNVGDMWELALSEMGSLASHNDWHKYLRNAFDAFSKYAYSVPTRSKTGKAVAAAVRSILARTGSSRGPLAVRTVKGKEFVNAKLHKLLNNEGIEMRMCRNPDLKYAIFGAF